MKSSTAISILVALVLASTAMPSFAQHGQGGPANADHAQQGDRDRAYDRDRMSDRDHTLDRDHTFDLFQQLHTSCLDQDQFQNSYRIQ